MHLDNDKKKLLFKAQDIYNIQQKIKKENLEKLLSIQALLNKLIRRNAWFPVFHSSTNCLEYLFFAKKLCDKSWGLTRIYFLSNVFLTQMDF